MPERSARGHGGAAAAGEQFDAESVRRILERAAVEQHRLDNEPASSYSFEELQEMAAEAGISPEALRAAVAAHRQRPARGARATGDGRTPPGRRRHRRNWLESLRDRMPQTWSPAARRAALTSVGAVTLFGVLLALPAAFQALFWMTLVSLVVLSVLVLLGISPF